MTSVQHKPSIGHAWNWPIPKAARDAARTAWRRRYARIGRRVSVRALIKALAVEALIRAPQSWQPHLGRVVRWLWRGFRHV